MSKAAGKTKKNKPVRRAERWGSQVLPMAGKILTVAIAVVVMGLMFSALQALGTAWLRVALSLLIASGMLLMHYGDGLNKGIRDAAASRYYEHASAKGRELSGKDDAACYHPLKALCACMVVYGIPLALAAYLAATAQDYTYVLQDLPTWLTGTYGGRMDVMAPLGAYAQTASLGAVDWIRMAVRVMELIFVNLFSNPQTMGALIDRLSPLFILLYPASYMAGYLRGPSQNDKREAMNRRAKKVAVRKAQKKSLVDELVGEQNQVHYGHKVETEKHKKKELI